VIDGDVVGSLTLAVAIGSGVVGGVFFAFSAFVMRALGRLPAADGLAAMRSINVAAVRPAFMLAFIGTAVASLALAVWSLLSLDDPHAGHILLGSGLYLVGSFGLTAGYHVPRNEELAGLRGDGVDVAARWARYVRGWTAWNHVRTVASLAAATILAMHAGLG